MSASLTTDATGNPVAQSRYLPYGQERWTSGAAQTDFTYTGQRANNYTHLIEMGARWYDPQLNRWISPDSIVPQPDNPQSLNRFSYVLDNPVRYTDLTGHWTEDQLSETLGKDWREKYFGKEGVFENRDKLLEFLMSEKTTSNISLGLVSQFFQEAAAAHSIGIGLEGVDALGARVSWGLGSAGFVSGSMDAVLNLKSGELSFFGSPEVGFILGGSLSIVGGITFMKNLPSNEAYRGTFEAAGLVGGEYVGLNGEFFWGAPLSDRYDPRDNAHGIFIGAGPAVALGAYGAMSYSFEVYREDVQGGQWFPHFPSGQDVLNDLKKTVKHDLLFNSPWP